MHTFCRVREKVMCNYNCLKFLFFVTLTALTSCVQHQEAVITKTAPPPLIYTRFMKAIKQADVNKINSMLAFRCEFKQYPGMTKGWYGFYRDEKLMIGPFPLKQYRKADTLNLTRPAGYRKDNYSRFHVFSNSYDLYLYFGLECVWIEGSGATGSKQTKMYVY